MKLALLIGALLLLAAPAAYADTVTMTTRASAHEARVSPDEVTWHSIYLVDTSDIDRTDTLRFDLARPIRATLDTGGSPGVTPIRLDGAIVAFLIDAGRVSSWNDAVVVSLHEARARASEEILEPPMARGGTTARIVVSGDDDLRFEPDESQLERHVGYWAASTSRESERRACDENIASRTSLRLDETPIYMTGDEGTRGLRGHFTTRAERARPGVFGAAFLFLLVIVGLGVAHLRLSGRARIEQAEAVLREEYGEEWQKPS